MIHSGNIPIRAKEKGITLLIAMVVSAIILILSFSTSIIASRSFNISGAARESQLAYYAAEAGSECARYWSLVDRKNFSDKMTLPISCNGQNFFTTPPTVGQNIFHFEFGYTGYPYYSSTTVTRLPGIFNLDIDAKGYNTVVANTARKYERKQNLKAYGICSYRPDIMLVVDRSGSINAGEMAIMKTALTKFVDTLNPTQEGVHIGLVFYDKNINLASHLSYDKTALINAIQTLTPGGGTNTAEGLRYARHELAGRTSPQAGDLFCPIAAAPNRALVYFNSSQFLPQSGPVSGQSLANIPAGTYNIQVTTCDTRGNPNSTDLGRRNDSAESFEKVTMSVRTEGGGEVLLVGTTKDLQDSLKHTSTTTLFKNVEIGEDFRNFVIYHDPLCSPDPNNPPPAECNHKLAPVCAAFENLDGLTNFDPVSNVDSHDRPDNQSPDFVILITDGGADRAFPCDGGSAYTAKGLEAALGDGYREATRDVKMEADSMRDAGVDSFVIGIGTTQMSCEGSSCSQHLANEVASYAAPDPNGSPDPDGNAFYFDAANFNDLDTVLSQIVNCVHPLSDE